MKFYLYFILILFTCLPVTVNSQSLTTELISEPVFNEQMLIGTAGTVGKPPVVLVHGLGDEASTSWDTTIKYLQKNFYIFSFDLPGFGQSAKSNQLYSPSKYSELIHYLTKKYINKPFHLIGHSMGGAIALNYAAIFPHDVKSLTLVDPAGILHRLAYTQFLVPMGIDSILGGNILGNNKIANFANSIIGGLEKKMPVDMNAMISTPFFREHALGENPLLIAGLALVLHDFSLIPQQVETKTLIIWGRNDQIAPLRTGHVLNALIPHSKLHIIPDAGHVPFIEQPVAFHQTLLQHLSAPARNALQQNKLPNLLTQNHLECSNKNKQIYTGTIETLLIRHCKNIVIRDANIKQLSIINSEVSIENSTIKNDRTALIVKMSRVTLTAGTIAAGTAIKAYDSQLDIAGTFLNAREAAIIAPVESTVIFSLVGVDSPYNPGQIMHGLKVITPAQPL